MSSLPVDDEHAPLYSVGQVAGMLDVQQAFLRRLDEFEVVRPQRSAGGQRRYSRHEIDRVQHVVRLAGEGMTLPAIRRVLELEQEVRRLRAQVKAARRRIADLETAAGPPAPARGDGRSGHGRPGNPRSPHVRAEERP